jgi:hypothetical protein
VVIWVIDILFAKEPAFYEEIAWFHELIKGWNVEKLYSMSLQQQKHPIKQQDSNHCNILEWKIPPSK